LDSRETRSGIWLAALAVVFFSTSPIFLIWADPLSAYEKTAWRMLVGSLAVFSLAIIQGRLPRYRRGDGGKFLLFGLVTALHFVTYIAALSFTSIAHALTVTYTSPVFVTLFSALFLGEMISWRKGVGIAVVLGGIALLVGFQPMLTPRMLIGDGLALITAITFGIYSVAGRSQRHQYPLLTYAFAVYGIAGLLMLPAAIASWTPEGYRLPQILSIAAAGVVPLAIGHTLYNAAVRRTHATYVNLISTQEVTGGVLLGMLLLGQMPTWNAVVGALVTLVGIVVVLVAD
jgi:drug/metabolite transporter (DMT)-like permease